MVCDLAQHSLDDVNVAVEEEGDAYGDVVVLPFVDHYDLVVLKTVAICQHGM